jgi:hypothetical protein
MDARERAMCSPIAGHVIDEERLGAIVDAIIRVLGQVGRQPERHSTS